MKRRNTKIDNSVDGNQIKKIKKLMFKLNEDENEEITTEINQPQINSINKNTKIDSDSDDNQSDNESEEISIDNNNDDEATINEEDEAALAKFMNQQTARVVIDEMKDAKTEVAENCGLYESDDFRLENNESLKNHFQQLINLLENYKKGRQFPKTVKVLPQATDWCYIMEKLSFPTWSNAAVAYMTDQFKAKGGEPVKIYYQHFLLPFVRENIAKNNRLEDVLYKTLVGALFRHREFMHNILLPWCDNNLNGREAKILGNILKNSTVKVESAGGAMGAIIELMPFSKERLVILNSLLEKKYNLSYQAISAFVDYFHRAVTEDYSHFFADSGRMPLLWFQMLHLFVSLYYPHFSRESIDKLLEVCQIHVHEKITDKIVAFIKLAPNNEKKE